MNPVEKIVLAFIKTELQKNPALAGSLLQHLLEQLKVSPEIASDIAGLAIELVPILLQSIK